MSLFGGSLGRKKPGSFFDPEPYYGTPGYGGPLPGQQGLPDLGDDPLGLGHPLPQGQFGIGSAPGGPLDPNRPPQTEQVPAQPQRWVDGGKFGWKDAAGLALGAIGDAFTTQAGGQAQFAPHLMQGFQAQRAAKAAQEEYNRRRANELEDYEKRQAIDARFATPKINDTVADYEFIKAQLGEEGARSFLQNKADPPQYRQGSDGQFYRIQTSPTANALPKGYSEDEWEVVPSPQQGAAPPALPQQSMGASGGLPPGIRPGSPEAYQWLVRNLPPNRVPMGSPVGRR